MPRPRARAALPLSVKPKLEFFVDPRLELDGVVHFLSGLKTAQYAKDFMVPDIEYLREVKRRFAPFQDHPAVRLQAKPAMRAFDFGQRGQGLMRLSPLPDLRPHTQISIAFLSQYAGSQEALDRWLDSLRDFARDSKFMDFFKAKSRLLDPDLARLKADIEKSDYIGKIEAYTGLPFEGRYAFVLSPFILSDTGANIVQRGEDGLADIISVVGPAEHAASGTVSCTYQRLHARIWHEAAHGVMDNVTELFSEDIAKKRPVQTKQTKEYQNWMHHVREHMVRSIMLRLVSHEISAALSDEELRHEEECGLPYLWLFKKRLGEYEKDRKRYPTIADFYPRLLDVIPAPAKGKAAPSSPLDREGDPYRDWITENAMPFYTESQRARALWYLDLMLSRARHPGLLLKRASLNYLLGRTAEAVKDADAVLALRPKDEGALLIRRSAAGGAPRAPSRAPSGTTAELPAETPSKAKPLIEEGVQAFLSGDFAAAVKRFSAAIELAPADAAPHTSIAVAYEKLGEDQKALESYGRAIELGAAVKTSQSQTMAAAALSSRAALLERLKRPKEARADLQKALQIGPTNWDQKAPIEKRIKGLG